jgi:hypothetical protein
MGGGDGMYKQCAYSTCIQTYILLYTTGLVCEDMGL